MRTALLILLTATACRRGPWIVVEVRSAANSPIAGATVSAVCEPLGSAAALAGDDGLASLQVLHYEPRSCTMTAAHEGFATVQRAGVSACEDRATCTPLKLRLETE